MWFSKTKKFKEMYEAFLEFHRGGRVFEEIPSTRQQVWIFSGTALCEKKNLEVLFYLKSMN